MDTALKTARAGIRDDRGAAMTEALLVLPFLILIWMGLAIVHEAYVMRLRAQIEAGAQALQMSTAGECGSSETLMDKGVDGPVMDEEPAGILSSILGGDPLDIAHSRAEVEREIAGVEGGPAGPGAVTGRQTVMCQQKPVDGLLDLVSNAVKDILGVK